MSITGDFRFHGGVFKMKYTSVWPKCIPEFSNADDMQICLDMEAFRGWYAGRKSNSKPLVVDVIQNVEIILSRGALYNSPKIKFWSKKAPYRSGKSLINIQIHLLIVIIWKCLTYYI